MLLEPSGPVQACNGTALPFCYIALSKVRVNNNNNNNNNLLMALQLIMQSFCLLNQFLPSSSILDKGSEG